MRQVRIGCGSAYADDRIEPAIDLLEQGELDFMSLDCLGERTLVQAQLRWLEDPTMGYDARLDRLVKELATRAIARGIKSISNMGMANPLSGARRTKEILGDVGYPDAKVAAITGDNVLDLVREQDSVLSKGCRISELGEDIVSANAYIGVEPILEALQLGADVVVGGRLADPSLFLAPAIHEFGWRLDDWGLLAAGQTVGHLLECGVHLSGGNFADPPYREIPDLWNLGLPIADVYPDGTFTLSKLPGTGGAIDVLNCKAQLVYEIHDPSSYLTPDVVLDVTNVQFEQRGQDRVYVCGAAGRERPKSLKVLVGVREGFIGEGEISFAGPGALERARLAADTVTKRLANDGVPIEEVRVDFIGWDSLHGSATPVRDYEPWEVRLPVAARCRDRAAADAVGTEVEFQYLGAAAGGDARRTFRPVLALYSTLLPREAVHTSVSLVEA